MAGLYITLLLLGFALLVLSPVIVISTLTLLAIKKSKRNHTPVTLLPKVGLIVVIVYVTAVILAGIGFSHNGFGPY